MATSTFEILVVEDNQQLLHVILEMLEVLGHRGRGCATAEDAVEVLKGKKFDVLLTDINLPGMSGVELAKRVAVEAPEVKIVFASGFGYLVAEKLPFNFTLLPKPYNVMQLREALVEDTKPMGLSMR
jgi:CheY-like chemotaxis protein